MKKLYRLNIHLLKDDLYSQFLIPEHRISRSAVSDLYKTYESLTLNKLVTISNSKYYHNRVGSFVNLSQNYPLHYHNGKRHCLGMECSGSCNRYLNDVFYGRSSIYVGLFTFYNCKLTDLLI